MQRFIMFPLVIVFMLCVLVVPAHAASTIDTIVQETLRNEQQFGFNPTTNQLYINWVYGSHPLLINNPSHTATLKDRLTDLRFLHALLLWKAHHPTDTQFDATIVQWRTIIHTHFSAPDPRGWVYDDLEDMSAVSDDPWYAQNASNMVHSWMTKTGSTGRDDWDLEQACAIIQEGQKTHNSAMTATGTTRLAAVFARAYNAQYHLIISRGIVKVGEVGQEIFSLVHAGHIAQAHDLYNGANLLKDTSDGAYFAQAVFGSGPPKVQTTKVDPGRLASMLQAAHVVGDLVEQAKLIGLLTGPAYYAPGHGYVFEMRPNFTLIASNWVTSEANGIACIALEQAA